MSQPTEKLSALDQSLEKEHGKKTKECFLRYSMLYGLA